MNNLELRLKLLNGSLFSNFLDTQNEVDLLLSKFEINFPTYTDHSIRHSKEVLKIASELLTEKEILNLNEDEIYILMMACILHDIGMCIPTNEIESISLERQEKYQGSSHKRIDEDFIRDIHHELSNEFILKEFSNLKIPNEKYAKAIGLISLGHRKVALDDHELFPTKFFVKDGRSFVCLPYLACILRLADELDITYKRTPKLLTKYYMPDNVKSLREWEKHLSTMQVNYTEDKVIIEVSCSDHSGLAALEEQLDKIKEVIKYCQKVIRTISNTEARRFEFCINQIEQKYNFIGFDPKGIKFSFDVKNVVKTFIGEDLYNIDLVALREAVQNSIDSCRYKQGLLGKQYNPLLKILISDENIKVIDNGLGMDEFIIENFFGKLGCSYYEQEKVKKEFEAIGQFGIGVFSYFLLSEYIDIETKTKEGKSLKFRIDNDPISYFHFFDQSNRTEIGTTITLFLKQDKRDKYKTSDYVKYLHSIFQNIEFTINININDESYDIPSRALSLDLEDEIKKRLKVQYKNNLKDLIAIRHSIDNEDYEGECALIIQKFTRKNPFEDIFKYFDYESFNTEDSGQPFSQISILQKGVFVNFYSSNYLSFCIGKIDFKNNRRININRNEFSDIQEVYKIIDVFNAELIIKIFKEIKQQYSLEYLAKISDSFLSNYLNLYTYNLRISMNLKNLRMALEENIYIEIYENNVSKIINLKTLVDDYETFILISNLENRKNAYNSVQIPIVLASGFIYFSGSYSTLYYILSQLFNYKPSIVISNNKCFQKMTHGHKISSDNIETKLIRNNIYEAPMWQEIEKDIIAVDPTYNKTELRKHKMYLHNNIIVNNNHPFFQYVNLYFNELLKEKDIVKVIRNTIQLIVELSFKKRILLREIEELNELIKPINKFENFWTFTKKDFQIM
jgi:molecular chaperone HtpG